MSGAILDGKAIASRLVDEIRQTVEHRITNGRTTPGLAVVLVGDNAASQLYVANKKRTADSANIRARTLTRSSTTTEGELVDLIDGLNKDRSVNGILVQLPLPSHIRVARR